MISSQWLRNTIPAMGTINRHTWSPCFDTCIVLACAVVWYGYEALLGCLYLLQCFHTKPVFVSILCIHDVTWIHDVTCFSYTLALLPAYVSVHYFLCYRKQLKHIKGRISFSPVRYWRWMQWELMTWRHTSFYQSECQNCVHAVTR